MDKHVIYLSELDGTTSNIHGFTLYTLIKSYLQSSKEGVTLSFKGVYGMSSSFLNSSLGELIEEYSLDTIKERVSFTDYKPSHLSMLKEYFSSYHNH